MAVLQVLVNRYLMILIHLLAQETSLLPSVVHPRNQDHCREMTPWVVLVRCLMRPLERTRIAFHRHSFDKPHCIATALSPTLKVPP